MALICTGLIEYCHKVRQCSLAHGLVLLLSSYIMRAFGVPTTNYILGANTQ